MSTLDRLTKAGRTYLLKSPCQGTLEVTQDSFLEFHQGMDSYDISSYNVGSIARHVFGLAVAPKQGDHRALRRYQVDPQAQEKS